MRPESYSANSIVHVLQRQLVATIDEMKDALGTRADITVFRKLQTLDYLSSYSHGGKYYTLQEVARFDDRGLWTYRGVHFSRFGSLLDTAETFVNRSERGFFASELSGELQVEAKEPLLKLVRQKRLTREDVSGLYLYCSADRRRRREQLVTRELPVVGGEAFAGLRERSPDSEDTKASVVFFMSLLDERQRRLFAALESLRLGRGGDQTVSQALGMDPHTIAKGRRELVERDLELDRLRRPGGGRKPVEKKRPRSSPKSKS
jgi:hypothetical protein